MDDTLQTPQPTAETTLHIGMQVHVVLPLGSVLINSETGGFFVPGEPTLQQVTHTLKRRLADGDLVLHEPPA